MSSTSTKPENRSYRIVAIVKKKRSKKVSSKESGLDKLASKSPSPLEPDKLSVSDSVDSGIQQLQATPMANVQEPSAAELNRQLAEAYEDLDLAESKIEEDSIKIADLEVEINALRKRSSELESKVVEMETVSAELDDDSFSAAQEFQYKKQIDELQEQVDKGKNLQQELLDTKIELQEVRAQYEAIKFQKDRSTMRDKMKNLSDEKTSKEELLRLQKELRAAERNLQQQQSTFEAQLKATQNSMQRVQEKNKAIQNRCDEVEKERMQLKLENTRLEKKLEKSGAYAEKKRIKEEQEAAEMELKNMKRKNAKLEKRLSMSTQMLDLVSQGSSLLADGNNSPASSGSPSGVTSPVPVTLSEARIMNLEKELQQLELRLSMSNEENRNLTDRAITAEKNVENLTKKLQDVDSEEKETKSALEIEAESFRQQPATPSSSVGDDDSLHAQVKQLEKELEQNSLTFRVKEKDLWATIEAQKRQITELEMEKIVLEERLLEDDATDLEEDAQPENNSAELKEKVQLLEDELHSVREENEQLRAEVDKLRIEAAEIMQSLEAELNDVTDSSQEEIIRQQNEELKKTLEEKSEQYVDTIREIARLRSIIEDQENEITIMRATQQYQVQASADQGREISSNGTVTPEEPKKKRSVKVLPSKSPAKSKNPDEAASKKPPAIKKKPKKKTGDS